MTKNNRIENIALELEQGDEALKESMVLLEHNLPKGALARIYYSLFHYVKALLFSLGLEAKTHDGTSHLFNLHFIKKGLLPAHFGKTLSRLQKYRELADYDPACLFSSDDVKIELQEAHEFSTHINNYLRDKGFLKPGAAE
jgi:uncharacterized protein (UPF0332 family)